MPQTNVKEAIELLISTGYLTVHRNILTLTDKVLELDPGALVAIPPAYTKSVIRLDNLTKSALPNPGEQSTLIKFIIDCEVPQKIKAADGKSYWANKYSKEAEKELAKILSQGYQLDILVAATKLYYKSAGFCEAVSNYICRSTWLTHYNEMAKQLQAGTAVKHIQTNLNDQAAGGPMYNDR